MNLIARQLKKQRRQRLSGDWQPSRTADRAENELFDASFELAEAAQNFDQSSGIRRTAPVTAAVLGCQVADWIEHSLEPRGVGVIIEAEHLCMSLRGAQKPGALTTTSALRGQVRDDSRTRQEFLSLVTR